MAKHCRDQESAHRPCHDQPRAARDPIGDLGAAIRRPDRAFMTPAGLEPRTRFLDEPRTVIDRLEPQPVAVERHDAPEQHPTRDRLLHLAQHGRRERSTAESPREPHDDPRPELGVHPAGRRDHRPQRLGVDTQVRRPFDDETHRINRSPLTRSRRRRPRSRCRPGRIPRRATARRSAWPNHPARRRRHRRVPCRPRWGPTGGTVHRWR